MRAAYLAINQDISYMADSTAGAAGFLLHSLFFVLLNLPQTHLPLGLGEDNEEIPIPKGDPNKELHTLHGFLYNSSNRPVDTTI